jgi:hypothetical protein
VRKRTVKQAEIAQRVVADFDPSNGANNRNLRARTLRLALNG